MHVAIPDEAFRILEEWTSLFRNSPLAGFDDAFLHLIGVRVSQLNGCANDLNFHTSEAARKGTAPQRLHLVAAWREAPVFLASEKAALALAEHLTLLDGKRRIPLPGELAYFDSRPAELAKLTTAIAAVNASNRLAIGLRYYDPSIGWW